MMPGTSLSSDLGCFYLCWRPGTRFSTRVIRPAIGWVGFIWFVPLVGAVMYFVFGVNRIRHKAALLRRNLDRYRAQAAQPECLPEELQRHLPGGTGHLEMLARVVGGVVTVPCCRAIGLSRW